jgi:CO/xanthine dehydrogenase Mo-binding subunit
MIKAWRNDAEAKVTGRARYTDDLKVHGVLHAVPVYADHVRARLRGVDANEAAARPGVVRVLTAKDVPGEVSYGQIQRDYPMFVSDAIRSRGDVVALIVARTRAEAIAAVPFVRVDAEPLPPLTDPEEALRDGAPLVHEAKGTNVVNHHKVRLGDADAALARAHLVIRKEFSTSRVEHAYLEPEAALCIPRPDGVMEVYGSMQHPFSTRRFVAALLGVKLAEVEVRTVPMGGGFGGKDDTAAIVCARTALAARLTGRPVKTTYDREWSMRESYKRHPYGLKYEVGFDAQGLISGSRVRIVADAGAYCSVTPWVTWRSTVQCCGPYCAADVHGDVYGVHTNNVFTGAMRGFGSPQVNFAVEQLMDIAADELGISPVEIRRRNMVRQGSRTITGQVLGDHTVSLPQVLDAVLAASGFEDKLARCSRGAGDTLYGIGLAMSYRGMSLGAEGMDFSAAIVNVQFDGSILLEVAIHENGQGAESAMVLLLAELLGVDKARIRYRMASTSSIPDGGTTVASRGTLMGGSALVDAATKVKAKMARVAARALRCLPEDVAFANETLRDSASGAAIGFDEAVHEMFLAQEHPFALGSFKAPKVSWDEETGQGDAYFTWVYGAQVVELEVDACTSKVRLLHAYAAHDVGRALNPPSVRGQFYGGMAMGIGYGLHEELVSRDGVLAAVNFDKYAIPRAKDLPEMTAVIVENADPLSRCGAKGIGEPTNELMAPAIANALARATGRRFLGLPMRVEVAR